MICPQCKSEYEKDFKECIDCKILLIKDKDFVEKEKVNEVLDEAVCPKCLNPMPEHSYECPTCKQRISVQIDPLAQVYAQGELIQKGTANPKNIVVLIGIWLLFSPTVLISFLQIFLISSSRKLEFQDIYLILFSILCSFILYKTTINYVKIKKKKS